MAFSSLDRPEAVYVQYRTGSLGLRLESDLHRHANFDIIRPNPAETMNDSAIDTIKPYQSYDDRLPQPVTIKVYVRYGEGMDNAPAGYLEPFDQLAKTALAIDTGREIDQVTRRAPRTHQPALILDLPEEPLPGNAERILGINRDLAVAGFGLANLSNFVYGHFNLLNRLPVFDVSDGSFSLLFGLPHRLHSHPDLHLPGVSIAYQMHDGNPTGAIDLNQRRNAGFL